jgi:hypothetical protein
MSDQLNFLDYPNWPGFRASGYRRKNKSGKSAIVWVKV